MDQLVIEFKASGGDWKVLRDGLNLGDEAMLEDSRIMYIKTNPGDPRFKFDIPTGNEGGAYQGEWVPAGTPNLETQKQQCQEDSILLTTIISII